MTVAAAALLFAALAAGQAAAPFPSQPALCARLADLYDETCGSGGYPSADSQAANLAKADVADLAQQRAFASLPAGLPSDQFDQAYEVAYFQQVERLALAKLGVTAAEFAALAQQVKASLLTAIDAQAGLSAADKARFKRIVTMDRVLLPSQFLQEPGIDPAQARQALNDVCGGTGLVTNAFADKGLGVMIFCPGYIIDTATVYAARPAAQRLEAMGIIVAHELAHTVDNNTLSVAASYGPMATCLKSLAAAEPDFPADLNPKFGEIAADFWAIEAFQQRHPAADAQSFEALKDGVRLHCGSIENAEHPAGTFRIGWAARNPDLRRFFGCRAVQPSKPSCGWQGLVH